MKNIFNYFIGKWDSSTLNEIKPTFILKTFLHGFLTSSIVALILYMCKLISFYGALFVVSIFSLMALVTGIISVLKSRKLKKDRKK